MCHRSARSTRRFVRPPHISETVDIRPRSRTHSILPYKREGRLAAAWQPRVRDPGKVVRMFYL